MNHVGKNVNFSLPAVYQKVSKELQIYKSREQTEETTYSHLQ